MSKKQNPKGPFEIRKQRLNIRFENENISWPFYFTQNEIIHLKKVYIQELVGWTTAWTL
jgi:hypothetical protein